MSELIVCDYKLVSVKYNTILYVFVAKYAIQQNIIDIKLFYWLKKNKRINIIAKNVQ